MEYSGSGTGNRLYARQRITGNYPISEGFRYKIFWNGRDEFLISICICGIFWYNRLKHCKMEAGYGHYL